MPVLASDNFNRSDNTDLGSNWDVLTGMGNLQIVGNRVRSSAADSNDKAESYNAVTWPNNQYSQVAIPTLGASTNGGPMARMSPSAATAYLAEASTSDMRLYKVVSGSWTNLASYGSGASAGNTIMIEVEGTTIRFFQNGTQRLSTTDSSISSGRAGIYGFVATGQPLNTLELDDWEGGDLFTATQSRFRWRNDDGSESGATWAAAENTHITAPQGAARRIRLQMDTSGDVPSANLQLEYRLKGQSGGWMIVRTS